MRTLLVGAGVHPQTLDAAVPSARRPRAVLLDGPRVAWVGGAGGDLTSAPPADRTVDLGAAWITPAFVDAHVHATATGLAATGVDLDGCASGAEALDRLRRHALASRAGIVLGTRWDDFAWPEGRPLTAAEVADAAPGRAVLLNRVDGHSCVVDAGTLARLPLDRLEGVGRDADGRPTGFLAERAGEAARRLVLGALPAAQVAAARDAACARAAALGIATLHEMGHPGTSGLDDALAWHHGNAEGRWPVEVLVWWADIDPGGGLPAGLHPGGDLFLDGSIGSHTAAVSAGYRDAAGHGELFHDDDRVAAYFTAWTAAGRGAGVHAIGDVAIEQALRGLEHAAREHGADAVRRCRHRVEHVELTRPDHPSRLAALGVVASVQPVFDALWGGADQLYARRFGPEAALASNPFSALAQAGVPLAFGSDSTVTPLDPWGAVVAAERHLGGAGLSRAAAFAAHTTGGRFVGEQDDVGALTAGARADLAVWDRDPAAVEDPRTLECLGTVVAGRAATGPDLYQQ